VVALGHLYTDTGLVDDDREVVTAERATEARYVFVYSQPGRSISPLHLPVLPITILLYGILPMDARSDKGSN